MVAINPDAILAATGLIEPAACECSCCQPDPVEWVVDLGSDFDGPGEQPLEERV